MSAYSESIGLPGLAHWMRVQAQEEQGHAMRFYRFIAERGGRVELQALDQPPAEYGSPLDLFEKTLAHERKVTGLINDLYALAVREEDYASQVFMQWFITEQVEEEQNATQILEVLKMIGDSAQGLLMLDRELGQRQAD